MSDNLNQNPKTGGKDDKDTEPSGWLRYEPVIIAGAVILLLLSIAGFAYDRDIQSLIGIITALLAIISIKTIKNKKVSWLLAGILIVTALVGFLIFRWEHDPEQIVIVGIFNDGLKAQESDEFVLIRSEDTKAIQIEAWTLSDNKSNHDFIFPRYEMQPGQECRVYTNEYHPESCGFSFGFGGSGVWNNKGDKASLKNAEGKLIHESSELITSDQVAIPIPTLSTEVDEFECVPRNTPREVGIVEDIIDGRTVDVRREDGSIIRVQYLGIKTIMEGHPLFERSVEINRDLVLSKEVALVEDPEAVAGDHILLRYVFVDDIFVNEWLVIQGYAAASDPCSCTDMFVGMQSGAYESERGFYAMDTGVEMYGNPFDYTPPEDSQKSSTVFLGNIAITDIFYDGVVSKQEPDEYVEIRNDGTESIQLNGWTLSDESNHTFAFPNFIMKPGQSCRIYTNEDHRESCGFNYRNADSAI